MQNDGNNKNLLLAISLSLAVILAWNYFYAMPKVEEQRKQAQQNAQTTAQPNAGATAGASPATASPATPGAAPATAAAVAPPMDRAAAIAAGPRVTIDTARLKGSIALKGGRIDDLELKSYHETPDRKSPNIVLFAPEGTAHPYYAEFGWVPQPGQSVPLPRVDTLWKAEDGTVLSVGKPVLLSFDNGAGVMFRRKISVDENYVFTVEESAENKTATGITLYPYGLVARYGTPTLLGFYVLHEGLIGVAGEKGLQEITYDAIRKEKVRTIKAESGWVGITDKYWAAAILPEQNKPVDQRYSVGGAAPIYQADVTMEGRTIAPGTTASVTTRLFAGAKEVSVVDKYEATLGVKQFELLIDWGWFHFITKPLFWLMTYIYQLVGNFGVTILLVTLIIKGLFFPIANKSYESMARMKAVQPEMTAIRERFADDKMKQQQAMMELYKKEKINPISGCVPVLLQIPVFFALYKVLFITIEMRHAPFFGWIKDLAAPDPTSIFNLFGLLPYTLPDISFLHLGIWPIIMGFTMFLQMKMNPEPPDPVQKAMFSWMPLIFTFMLASFPAGLVIYWAWNNILSVSQQALIMRKNGTKIELWDNIRKMFSSTKPSS
jgi:YidC/Oxa1 family membrane protein insertase